MPALLPQPLPQLLLPSNIDSKFRRQAQKTAFVPVAGLHVPESTLNKNHINDETSFCDTTHGAAHGSHGSNTIWLSQL